MSTSSSREKQRRNLIKAIGVVGATRFIPDEWMTPTIDSVVTPSHAQTTEPPRELDCSITRGLEGASPEVFGGNFFIATLIELFDPEIAVGDTISARHQVPPAGFDETFPGNVIEGAASRLFAGGIPASVPLPAGVVPGQTLIVTITMTSGALSGLSCTGSLEIES